MKMKKNILDTLGIVTDTIFDLSKKFLLPRLEADISQGIQHFTNIKKNVNTLNHDEYVKVKAACLLLEQVYNQKTETGFFKKLFK